MKVSAKIVAFLVAVWGFSACALAFNEKPILSSASSFNAECVMEATSRRILSEEHGDVRLPMASTTKIAAAITVLESGIDTSKVIEIPQKAVGIEGSSVYLKEGDEYSVKDLLYGLMLRSGNDCAVALADCIDGGTEAFACRMNKTAQRAGAINTHFRNPHGLPTKNHYTTAVDLSLITAYALENPVFSEIVATKYYEPRGWTNKNKMLTRYNGAIGVKTGYTKQAGRCLVTAAERNGMKLICTVLNCPTMYERTTALLDDAFLKYKNRLILGERQAVSFEGGEGIPMQNLYYPMMEGEEAHLEMKAQPAKNKENKKIVGQFQIYLLKRLIFSGNLYKL